MTQSKSDLEAMAIVSGEAIEAPEVVAVIEAENALDDDSVPSEAPVNHECCGSKGHRHLKSCTTNET